MAAAAELYAKKADLGEECELYAHRIKIDAQTMLGEFMKAGRQKAGRPKNRLPRKPISEIPHSVACQSRQLARGESKEKTGSAREPLLSIRPPHALGEQRETCPLWGGFFSIRPPHARGEQR